MLGIGDLENQKRYDIKFMNKSGWSAQPYMGPLLLSEAHGVEEIQLVDIEDFYEMLSYGYDMLVVHMNQSYLHKIKPIRRVNISTSSYNGLQEGDRGGEGGRKWDY